MKFCFKYHNLFGIIIIIFLSFSQILEAQKMNDIFMMSSVGRIENIFNNSMPVTFNSSTSCLKVQNGTTLLLGSSDKGIFSIDCEVHMNFNTLGIKLFPNPVFTKTKLKIVNPPPINEIFKISIWGVDGLKITSGKAT